MLSAKNLLWMLVACWAATACHLQKKNSLAGPAVQTEAIAADTSPYRAAATRHWELVHTGIDIRFNIPARTAAGEARLSLHPYWYATDSVVLDAKDMDIESVDGAGLARLPFTYDSSRLAIRLPSTYSRKDTLQLHIKYRAMPYATAAGGSSAISEDRGLYFVNAAGEEPYQPVQIWTQGETEANSHWFPTFDKSNFRSAFTITMHVPDSFVTLSNGLLTQSSKEPGGMRADTWEQKTPIPPYLVMMAAGRFTIARDTWQGKEVSYYVPEQYGPFARDIFQHTPEMLSFYSRLLGVSFPWDKYSQIVVYDYVSGAMENVSASLFGAFNLKDKRELEDNNNDYIVAHELFHQWFGDYVTAESWSNLTLNESFANYGEYLWSEYKYGLAAAQYGRLLELSKYLGQARRKDPPLVRYHFASQEDMFDRVSYSKGGLILHYMRMLAGDEAFFETLHRYLTRYAGTGAEAVQLRLVLEEVTGKDWNGFFDQWYYKGGHPVLEVKHRYDDAAQKLIVTVTQTQPDSVGLYRLPLKAQLIAGVQTEESDWLISAKETVFTYPYSGGQRPVLVPDARHWLPGELLDRKNAWQWQQQYQYSDDFISRGQAVNACSAFKNNDTALQVLQAALEDKEPVLRALAADIQAARENKNIPASCTDRLASMATEDPDHKVRAAAIAALSTTGNDKFNSIYELAVGDSSYRVAAAGLKALKKTQRKRALEYAWKLGPASMNGNPLLYEAASVIAREGRTEDYGFFEDRIWHLFERQRQYMLLPFREYLEAVKDEATYRKGVALLLRLAIAAADNKDGLFTGGLLYELSKASDQAVKLTTDREQADTAKSRREAARTAWETYKAAVTDKGLLQWIREVEEE